MVNRNMRGWMLVLLLLSGGVARSEPSVEPAPAAAGLSLRAALLATLTNLPAIQVSRYRVEESQGKLEETQGPFDWTVGAVVSYSDQQNQLFSASPSAEASRVDLGVTDSRAFVSKQFRSGVVLGPEAEWQQTSYRSTSLEPADTTSFKLLLTIPLLKGRGKTAAAADESAAAAGWQASRAELRHTIAASLRQAALAYWDYRLAQEQLQVQRESEADAQLLMERMRKLAEADQTAPADLNQVAANLADRQAATLEAEQQLAAARSALGLALGTPPDAIESLPPAADPFPAVLPDRLSALPPARGLVTLAAGARDDLKSLRWREEAALVLLRAARVNANPQVDVVLGGGYVREDDPQYVAKEDAYVADVALRYVQPLPNHAGRGRLRQANASYQQALLQTQDLLRNLSANVASTLSAMQLSGQEVEKARIAVASYQKAVASEEQKLKQGLCTVLDVMTMADRLRSARLTEASSRRTYANSLVNLRFETGTLISGQDERVEVSEKDLLTVPAP